MGNIILVDHGIVAVRFLKTSVLGLGISAGAWAGFLLLPTPATPVVVPQPKHAVVALADPVPEVAAPKNVITASSLSTETLEAAFGAKQSWTVKSGTRILIVPHHLVAAREIASLVSATEKPSVVYLVSPDHFSQGKTVFTTTDASFDTALGRVDGDVERTASLVSDVPQLRKSDAPFTTEHGVAGLLPFFSRAWPGIPVVPIIMRIDATQEDRADLSAALAKRLSEDPNALLVVTIDFSHYQPANVADFHDELAQDVVTSLADRETDRVELDSPGALAVALKTARTLGLGDVTIQAHTNSLRILESKLAQESTSHFLVSFSPGEIQTQQELSLLFVGDMMFDRTVASRMKTAGSFDYPFQKIRGTEDRFFRGQDVVVGNLEGPATSNRRAPVKTIDFAFDPSVVGVLKQVGFDLVSQANNHTLDQGVVGAEESRTAIKNGGIASFGDEVKDDPAASMAILERRGQRVALLAFNTTDNPIDIAEAEKSVESAKQKSNNVIVFMHWGAEYQSKPSQSQIDLAHWFIDRGVSAVIGSHPHWMQSVEVYKDHPIAYSLGNFIFDQDWSAETNFGLAVGVSISAQGTDLHLFPIKIEKSQPRLLTGVERADRLKKLAEISDPALNEQILEGTIRVP